MNTFVPTKTKNRAICITKNHINKTIHIYSGNTYRRKLFTNANINDRFGMYVITKNLGRNIHDSERNRKRKNKKKNKK